MWEIALYEGETHCSYIVSRAEADRTGRGAIGVTGRVVILGEASVGGWKECGSSSEAMLSAGRHRK